MSVTEAFDQLHMRYPEFRGYITPVQWAIAAMIAPDGILLLDLDLPKVWNEVVSMTKAWGIEA